MWYVYTALPNEATNTKYENGFGNNDEPYGTFASAATVAARLHEKTGLEVKLAVDTRESDLTELILIEFDKEETSNLFDESDAERFE